MVLDLLKWLRETSFNEKKKVNYYKSTNFCTKAKFILSRKKGLWMFLGKEQLILWITGSKRISFLTQEIGKKMIFP